jgi:ketosteroid isomerase-like protein
MREEADIRQRAMLALVLVVFTAIMGVALRVHAQSTDEAVIKTMYDRYLVALRTKDINAILSLYLPGESLVVFDAVPPRQYVGATAFRKDYEGFFAAFPGPNTGRFDQLHVSAAGTMAYAHSIGTFILRDKGGRKATWVFRLTDVFRKINGKWLIVHEHVSWPVDPVTGKADLLSKP